MMEMWKVFCVISIDNRWSDSPTRYKVQQSRPTQKRESEVFFYSRLPCTAPLMQVRATCLLRVFFLSSDAGDKLVCSKSHTSVIINFFGLTKLECRVMTASRP